MTGNTVAPPPMQPEQLRVSPLPETLPKLPHYAERRPTVTSQVATARHTKSPTPSDVSSTASSPSLSPTCSVTNDSDASTTKHTYNRSLRSSTNSVATVTDQYQASPPFPMANPSLLPARSTPPPTTSSSSLRKVSDPTRWQDQFIEIVGHPPPLDTKAHNTEGLQAPKHESLPVRPRRFTTNQPSPLTRSARTSHLPPIKHAVKATTGASTRSAELIIDYVPFQYTDRNPGLGSLSPSRFLPRSVRVGTPEDEFPLCLQDLARHQNQARIAKLHASQITHTLHAERRATCSNSHVNTNMAGSSPAPPGPNASLGPGHSGSTPEPNYRLVMELRQTPSATDENHHGQSSGRVSGFFRKRTGKLQYFFGSLLANERWILQGNGNIAKGRAQMEMARELKKQARDFSLSQRGEISSTVHRQQSTPTLRPIA
ncbi:hypothetical protein H4R34_004461 [Dimargaris verticillata]|uniref:Uncharacterized protein n=1 Tax=Dimargaris verticillata TaxID=2761393 RepID=A0A9W8B453_9FUNG|nr:hypothetical protein H4R34_004461 [Dimargaris verticillata]